MIRSEYPLKHNHITNLFENDSSNIISPIYQEKFINNYIKSLKEVQNKNKKIEDYFAVILFLSSLIVFLIIYIFYILLR